MDDFILLMGVFAVSVVFAVWCIGPTVGVQRHQFKAPPKVKQGAVEASSTWKTAA